MPFEEIINKMLDYLIPPTEINDVIENNLSGLSAIGGQGSGKTTTIQSLIAKLQKRLRERGYAENEFAYLHSFSVPLFQVVKVAETELDLEHLKYIFFVNDDAPSSEGQNSRSSLTKGNVRNSKYYFVIRHKLKDIGFKGQFTIFHLTQRYNALDKNLRVGTKVKLFKDFPEDIDDRLAIREYLGQNGFKYLKALNRKIFSPVSLDEKIQGLETGVFKFIDYPTIFLRVPKTDPSNPIIIKEIPELEETAKGKTEIEQVEEKIEETKQLPSKEEALQEQVNIGALEIANDLYKETFTTVVIDNYMKCLDCGLLFKPRKNTKPQRCYKCQHRNALITIPANIITEKLKYVKSNSNPTRKD